MTTPMNKVMQHLRRAVLLQDAGELTDGQLLGCFVSRREAAALELLVRRHGPMVWGVCRRLLRNHHDAEDAFQATFLVLFRSAASITPREMVGNWLYGVAHQTALKARATAAKQRARERQVVDMPEPAVKEPDPCSDLQAVLDQELSRLPDKYRVAIVLCDLEGKTRKEAARHLGCPEGTLAARLARGRVMLAKRLARHGLIVSGGALAGLLSRQAASAGVPTALVSSTIKAVTLGATAGAISVKVAALTEGVLKIMLLNKIKSSLVVLLVLGFLGVGTGGWTYQTQAAGPTEAKPATEPKTDQAKPTEKPKTDKPKDAQKRDPNEWRLLDGFPRDLPEAEVFSIEEVIQHCKNSIALATKEVQDAKDNQYMRAALNRLEQAIQTTKFIVPFMEEPAKKKGEEKPPHKPQPTSGKEQGDTRSLPAPLPESNEAKVVIKPNEGRLQLAPGTHSVRVALPLIGYDQFPLPKDVRAVSRTVEIAIQKGKAKIERADWGEAVEGVQVRLRPDKAEWAAGETPTFQLDVRNQGKQSYGVTRVPQICGLEVDGRWYFNTIPVDGFVSELKPGIQVESWVKVSLDGQWEANKAEEKKDVKYEANSQYRTLNGDKVLLSLPLNPGSRPWPLPMDSPETQDARACIQTAAKKVQDSKDRESLRKALDELERTVGELKRMQFTFDNAPYEIIKP